MYNPIHELESAIADVRVAWIGVTESTLNGPARINEGPGDLPALSSLSGSGLIGVQAAVARMQRRLDALKVEVAQEIARQSTADLGPDSLAKKHGFRSPGALIAATSGVSGGEANRLIAVGEGTTPRQVFGATEPAKYPAVAAALAEGEISADHAGALITMFNRVRLRADRKVLAQVERDLVAQAVGLPMEQLRKVIVRAEAFLRPDDVAVKEHELRRARFLHLYERDGMVHLNGQLDPETAAPVKTVLDGIITAHLHAHRGALTGTAATGATPSGSTSAARDENTDNNACSDQDANADQGAIPASEERLTVAQLRADALAMLARHLLGCDQAEVPIEGATVIVRVNADDLVNDTGYATIDGIDQPVSIETTRRMAASGGVIPCVLGTRSEILDFGREHRFFSKAQRLALAERDGGCAMCALPPGMTRAHHIQWWNRDTGPTNLANGVLLCETCHHRIHDNGWEIRTDQPHQAEPKRPHPAEQEKAGSPGSRSNSAENTGEGTCRVRTPRTRTPRTRSAPPRRVWFVPPGEIDAARTPRPGGRARHDYPPTT